MPLCIDGGAVGMSLGWSNPDEGSRITQRTVGDDIGDPDRPFERVDEVQELVIGRHGRSIGNGDPVKLGSNELALGKAIEGPGLRFFIIGHGAEPEASRLVDRFIVSSVRLQSSFDFDDQLKAALPLVKTIKSRLKSSDEAATLSGKDE